MDASNLAAIWGSMAIMTSFLVFMMLFRSSTCIVTHSLKESPSPAEKILTNHCFGTLGRSISSGKYTGMIGLSAANSRSFSVVRFLYYGTYMVLTWVLRM